MGKMSQSKIAANYMRTLYKRRGDEDRPSLSDIFLQLLSPILVGILLFTKDIKLDDTMLLSVVATVTALLGTVVVFLFQVRLQINELLETAGRGLGHNVTQGLRATLPSKCCQATLLATNQVSGNNAHGTTIREDDLKLVDELFSQIVWAILIGILISIIGVLRNPLLQFCELLSESAISSIELSMSIHMALVLLMCTKRFSRVYERIAIGKE